MIFGTHGYNIYLIAMSRTKFSNSNLLITMNSKSESNRSATLAKGLKILDILGANGTPMRLREISQTAKLTKATTHRLLSTLVDHGLVRYDERTYEFRLGMRLFELSRQVWEEFDLRGSAVPEMTKLNELTGEAVGLAIINDSEGIYIDEIASRHHIRERNRIGQRIPLWQTAIGKVLIAGMQYDARTALVDKIDAKEISNSRFASTEALMAHLDLVNARGYAIEVEEHINGIMGVAAPIVDHRGISVAAMGLTGPTERLSRDKLHELGPTVIEATRRASLQAGGAPRPVSKVQKPVAPVSDGVSILVEMKNLIGECPVFDKKSNQLFWVDICKPSIYRYQLDNNELNSFSFGEMVTALDVVESGLIIASQSGLKLVDHSNCDLIQDFGHPERHIPTNRFNDGKCDSRGRFWVGTMAFNLSRNAGSLYRCDPDGTINRMEENLTLPNGMGWSPDNETMYFIDTADRRIYAYDFNEEYGSIENRRTFVEFADSNNGEPDGLAVDANGNIWVSLWDGWRISKFSPEGEHLDDVIVPVPRPTGCIFNELDYSKLFVTSARIRISEATLKEAPLSGSIMTISV